MLRLFRKIDSDCTADAPRSPDAHTTVTLGIGTDQRTENQ